MPYRFFFVSFLLLLIMPFQVNGDGMRLVNVDEELVVKILELNEDFVKASIEDVYIVSVSIRSEQDSRYPDAVIIDVRGKRRKVVCKVVEVSKRTGGVVLLVPRKDVSSIQITFNRELDVQESQASTFDREEENPQNVPIDPDKLREQIKEDLLSELEEKEEREGWRLKR